MQRPEKPLEPRGILGVELRIIVVIVLVDEERHNEAQGSACI